MNRPPSQAVIEAVEQTLRRQDLIDDRCGCEDPRCGENARLSEDIYMVARAAEAAALRAAADDYFNASSGTKARPHARSWLRARANKLTDTDDRSK